MQALQTQRAAFAGSSAAQPRRPARAAVAPAALFGRKAAPELVVEEPPAKRGWFGRPAPKQVEREAPARKAAVKKAAKPAPKQVAKPAPAKKGAVVKDKAAEYEKRKGVLGRAVSAFDFAETRSKSDAVLLYEAKYGERGPDGKMSREQYQALRRRIGGTYKDYFKGWVEVKGDYVDRGYTTKEGAVTSSSTSTVLPLAAATMVALFGATIYVVSATS